MNSHWSIYYSVRADEGKGSGDNSFFFIYIERVDFVEPCTIMANWDSQKRHTPPFFFNLKFAMDFNETSPLLVRASLENFLCKFSVYLRRL